VERSLASRGFRVSRAIRSEPLVTFERGKERRRLFGTEGPPA
jgi:hypothetical protein